MPPRRKAPTYAPSAATRMMVAYGPEDLLVRDTLTRLRDALTDEHGDLDEFRLDGASCELSAVFDEVRGYSLMGGFKLVIVEDADDFVKKHREALERYVAAPVDHACLVLRCQSWLTTTKLHKAILKLPGDQGGVVKCEAPGRGEAVSWIAERAASVHGAKLPRDAAAALVDRLGANLGTLDTEVAKLAAMVVTTDAKGKPKAGTIDSVLVEREVGRASEEKAWEVQAAVLDGLAKRDAGPMLGMVRELVTVGGQPDVLVMYFVEDLCRKLSVAAAMRRAGGNDATIGKALKLWGAGASSFHGVSRKIDEAKARRMLGLALRADARSKSGFGDATRNLEGLCVRLADVA
ncbi:MAG: DNA polymerase III subunit delta [Planctomycetota bacterium]